MFGLLHLIKRIMERVEPTEFYLMSLLSRSNQKAYCFENCIRKEEISNELSRDQERCLGISALIEEPVCRSMSRLSRTCAFDCHDFVSFSNLCIEWTIF